MRECRWDPSPSGPWIRWEAPAPGAHYIIGADVALGQSDGSDLCAAVVLRRGEGHTLVQVAEFADRVEPFTFGEILAAAGMRWNGALVNVERNMGLGVLTAMRQADYPDHLFYVPPTAGTLAGETERKFWLQTTATSKKFILDTLLDYMARKTLWLRSMALHEEVNKVTKDERNAPILNGRDRTVALLMAVYADATTPLVLAEEERPKVKRPPYGVDPYLWKKAHGVEEPEEESQPLEDGPEFEDSPGGDEAFW